MKNKIYLLLVLIVAVIVVLVVKHQKPESISLIAPKGYEKAHKIIIATEETEMRSALEYANSFMPQAEETKVETPKKAAIVFHPPMIYPKTIVKEVAKKVVKRQIAKTKLLARR